MKEHWYTVQYQQVRTIFCICVVDEVKIPVLVGSKALVHVKHFSSELLADVT